MRRLCSSVSLAVVLGLLLTAPVQAKPVSFLTVAPERVSLPKRECPDVGPPNTDVGLYKIISRRLACGRARAILRDWYHDATQKDSGPAGWRCAVVRRGRFEIRSYCHRDGRLIAFTRYTV